MKNPLSSVRIFAKETWEELLKADWPSKTELRDSTLVVVAAALLLGVCTSISDLALNEVVLFFSDLVR